MTKRTPTDDLLDEIIQICRIGAQPGGSQLLDMLYNLQMDNAALSLEPPIDVRKAEKAYNPEEAPKQDPTVPRFHDFPILQDLTGITKPYTPQPDGHSDDRPIFHDETTPSQEELQEAKRLNDEVNRR